MQPLSRVKSNAIVIFGDPEALTRRPALAAKIARCIAQWAEIEVHLGSFLGFLLRTNQTAALAMYSALENRTAQWRMIRAAAEASVPPDHFKVFAAFLSQILHPAMKERDRLAHWLWGYSDDLPDALLFTEPAVGLESLMRAITSQPGVERADVPFDYEHVYVVREPDLDGMITRSVNAKYYLRLAMATVWDHNSAEERSQYISQLSNVPQVRSELDRHPASECEGWSTAPWRKSVSRGRAKRSTTMSARRTSSSAKSGLMPPAKLMVYLRPEWRQ